MEKNTVFFQTLVNVIYHIFHLNDRQAVDCCLLENTIHSKVWPLSSYINPFPSYSSFQVPFFIPFLVDKRPTKIWSSDVFIPFLHQLAQDRTLACAQFKYFHFRKYKLFEKGADGAPICVPVIDLLLLEFIAGIPIGLVVIVRQILGTAFFGKKLLAFVYFGEGIFFHSP